MKKILLLLLCTIQLCAQSIGETNNTFAFNLFSTTKSKENNFVFSPYSIYSNLVLLQTGADTETAQELRSALQISSKNENFLKEFQAHQKMLGNAQLHIANGLFPQSNAVFLDSFLGTASDIFNAHLQPVSYSIPSIARKSINQWISEKTDGKIAKFLEPNDVDASTRMVIANAIYFEGEWVHPFQMRIKKGTPFFVADQSILVEMMQQTNALNYYENEVAQCLSLPFKRSKEGQPALECVLILPKGNLEELEKNLDPETFLSWIARMEKTFVNAKIPKFTIKTSLALNTPLQDLGIHTAFTNGADFSKMNGKKDLLLSKVLHGTFFSFYENGVTAAATTTSHMSLKCAIYPESPISFVADHPFLFFIIERETKTILFMGHLIRPHPYVQMG